MSDQRLRELERRWQETGSPDDEAAYLLERVRVGDLTRDRLELAAHCGHEGARRAVGEAHLPTDARFLALLAGLGLNAVVDVALAVSEMGLSRWEAEPLPLDSEKLTRRARLAVEATCAWVGAPTEENLGRVRDRMRGWEQHLLLAVCRRVTGRSSPTVPPANPALAASGYDAYFAPRVLLTGCGGLGPLADESSSRTDPSSGPRANVARILSDRLRGRINAALSPATQHRGPGASASGP